MADQRRGGIAYCDETWNPAIGCSAVSAGCGNCWAQRQAIRQCAPKGLYHDLVDEDGWTGKTRLNERVLDAPLRWRRPRRILVAAMGDLFHESRSDADIDRVFAVMALAPQHTFLVLTKRPERMRRYFLEARTSLGRAHEVIIQANDRMLAGEGVWPGWPLPHVWLGVSVEDQATLDERVSLLYDTLAAVRWVSLEPLLGPMPGLEQWLGEWQDDRRSPNEGRGLDWVVVGGESGPRARPCNVAWVRDVVRQCREACVPCFVKQDSGARSGEQGRIPDDLWAVKELPR
jgi:protein gp37